MNKAELIDAMAAAAGLSKADAKKALDGFVGATTEGQRLTLAAATGASVSLVSDGRAYLLMAASGSVTIGA